MISLKNVKNMIPIILSVLLWSCEVEPISPSNNGNNGWDTSGVVTNPPPGQDIEMRTSFSNDFDDWSFDIGSMTVDVETAFTEDWDNWDFDGDGVDGDIRTQFTEDWDNWKLESDDHSIRIRTAFTEDWDNWDIDDNNSSWHADVRTSFSEDFDDWDIQFNGHKLDARTAFSNDWDNWDVSGDFPEDLAAEFRIAVLFVPVITNVLIQKGMIEP